MTIKKTKTYSYSQYLTKFFPNSGAEIEHRYDPAQSREDLLEKTRERLRNSLTNRSTGPKKAKERV